MCALSVAMIVRNEATHLSSCYDSFRGLDVEWIIVDTGSTDDTRIIAEKFATSLTTFEWCDDFSAARNAALAQCTHPWIFVIDADERMTQESIDALATLSASPADRAYRYMTRNYTAQEMRSGFVAENKVPGYAGWYPSYKVRLFPNRPGVRFSGTIHELVEPSLEAADIPIENARDPILHFPEEKGDDAAKSKQSLYLRLGVAKRAEEPENPKAHLEFGIQCLEMGRYGEAAAALRDGLKLDPNFTEGWKDLGAALHLLGQEEEAERALRIALKLEDRMAEAWRNLGVVLSAQGQHAEALDAIRRASELAPHWSDAERYLREIESRRGAMDSDTR